MTDKNQKTAKPTHRVSFSRILNGGEDLGPAREIGAVWPRKGDKKGGIIKLDHIPIELTRNEGVLFLVPVD
mgnify:CR=1 FL=1